MNAFAVYQDYVALKRHFQSKNYDYFKFNGKVKVTVDNFEKRKDKAFFIRLARFKDPHRMLLYNLVEKDQWIGEICINETSLNNYHSHKKINESLSYHFETELAQFETVANMIEANGTHPKIIQRYLGQSVSLELLTLVVDICRPLAYWQRQRPNDIIMDEIIHRVNKYSWFMSYDRAKMKSILKKVLM